GAAESEVEEGVLKVDVSNNGPNQWSVQLLQSPVEIERGGKYKITFDARVDNAQSLVVKVGGTASRSWTAYLQEEKALSDDWQNYEIEFTMYQETDSDARFEFWLLNNGTYYLDNVSLVKTGQEVLHEEGTLTEEHENATEEWTLVWEENFDEINRDIWTFEIGSPDWDGDGKPDRWGNNELQYYQEDNAEVRDGKLIITAREETVEDMNTTFDYTSSRMITKDKYEVQYGRMEIRAKLPIGQGIWPAIWMLGNDIDTNPWPDCGEIDIMEYLGHQPSTVHGTVHGPISAGPGVGSSYTLEEGTFNEDFHVFAIEWDEDEVEFYVDDVLYHVANKYEIGEADWVFDHPHFFILNVAVGGNWPGNPDETTVFPQSMEVDYIRVYEDTNPAAITDLEVWDSEYEEKVAEGEETIDYSEAEIVNGAFENELVNDQEESPDNWYIWAGEGGIADGSVVDGELKMDISAVGNQSWAIQLAQFVKLPAGKYRVTFKARADEPRDIIAMVQHEGGSWTVYGEKNVMLSTTMQEFTVDVTVTEDDIPKFSFNFGNTPEAIATTVYIDDVVIKSLD
ncbi:MAG: family 16 glycosylhydrolase, partial [Halanaerobiales bacterium]